MSARSDNHGARRVLTARAARVRIRLARDFIERAPPGAALLAIGPTRAALTELVAATTLERGATFGIHRKTLSGLATEAAAVALAQDDFTVAKRVVIEAVVRAVVRDALDAGELSHFEPVARTPGFAGALARTLEDLELDGVAPDAIARLPRVGPDLAALATRFATALGDKRLASRAAILRRASAHFASNALAGLPVVMLDVALERGAERDFAGEVLARAPDIAVVVSPEDVRTLDAFAKLDFEIAPTPEEEGALATFRARLFDHGEAASCEPIGGNAITLLSAPSEALEAIEIARAVRDESERGMLFDEMAIVLRNRDPHGAHLETAFARASIPIEFESGTRKPHVTGRALLALLACRAERGSGRRLFEYLSTCQMPADRTWEEEPITDDEELGRFGVQGEEAAPPLETEARTLPKPPLRRWLRMLGEIGLHTAGRDHSILEYFLRRVGVAQQELSANLQAVERDEADDDLIERMQRELAELDELKGGLRPVLERLDAVPASGTWGEFLGRIRELARVSLNRPDLVISALGELAPLANTPMTVELSDVIGALQARLRWLEGRPKRGNGRVLVTTPAGIRARARRLVVVPGLAEGIFPARTSEDPLLLDEARTTLAAGLATVDDRTQRERLALHLAVGAATERILFTYPRVDAQTGRARVPSVYALEVARALDGTIPTLDAMDRAAAPPSRIALVSPAPHAPEMAIDDLEYTLSVVRELKARGGEKGRARFLIEQHPLLARALRARYQRYNSRSFSQNDGLLAQRPETIERLAQHRLQARAFAPSTLEAFAVCPYKFYLRGIARLSPQTESEPIDRLDPRLYGELYHRCQAMLAARLLALELNPQDPEHQARVLEEISGVVREVADATRPQLEPIVPRVFDDEMERIASDIVGWADEELARGDGFRPLAAELSFGLPRHEHLAPQSVRDAVRVTGGYRLKGAIDSIEQDSSRRLRVTDYKTGRFPEERRRGYHVVCGGEMLQPVLYALAVEVLRGSAIPDGMLVSSARLYYATRRGGFESLDVAIEPDNVGRALRVLEAIDQSIESGVLVAAPKEKACTRCPYQPVCGPNEEARTKKKEGAGQRSRAALEALARTRGEP